MVTTNVSTIFLRKFRIKKTFKKTLTFSGVVCGARFAKIRSLDVHMKRSHNPKATVFCPENCGKSFTSKAAIKKHLLSHRPQHEWPFWCEFCGKRFQARADLPKHYKTSQHKNDPRIPDQGTPEWTDLMRRSGINDFYDL